MKNERGMWQAEQVKLACLFRSVYAQSAWSAGGS